MILTHFHILVGYGATSVVYKASMLQMDAQANPIENESSSKCVAIKKVKNIFENEIYAHRILREIRLLRILRGHKNVSREFIILSKTFVGENRL